MKQQSLLLPFVVSLILLLGGAKKGKDVYSAFILP